MNEVLSSNRLVSYEIIESLWEESLTGGYRAIDRFTREPVLLLILLPGQSHSENWHHAFQQQVEFLLNLQHPNLLPVTTFGIEDEHYYLVMPWQPGRRLSQAARKPKAEKEALGMVSQLAAGLSALHENQLKHGCLSPETVWLRDDGTPLLFGYGLAAILAQEILAHVPENSLGTGLAHPAYTAPEQVLGREPTVDGDLYALGAILFTLLTGQRPHEKETNSETALARLYQPLAWPCAARKQLSKAVTRWVTRSLNPHRAGRFASLAEMQRLLERMLAGKWVWISLPAARQPKSGKFQVTLAVGLALLAFASAALLAWQHERIRGIFAENTPVPTQIAGIRQQASPTPTVTRQPKSTPTFAPTATPTPQAEVSPEKTAAPEDASPVAAIIQAPGPVISGKPYTTELAALNPENLSQLQEVSRLGWGRLMQVAWANNSQQVAFASSAGVFIIGHNGMVQYLVPEDWATSVTFSNDDQILAVGLMNGDIQLWDWQAGTVQMTLKGHTKRVSEVLFSPNQRFAFSASFDQNIKVWDITTGQEVKNLPAHPLPIKDIAISEDGRLLVSCSNDSIVKLWDISAGKKLNEFRHTGRPEAVAISRDGAYVAAGGSNGEILQWLVTEGRMRVNPIRLSNQIWTLSFSEDASSVRVGIDDGQSLSINVHDDNYIHRQVKVVIPGILFDRLGPDFEFSSYTAYSPHGETASINWNGSITIDKVEKTFNLPYTFESFDQLYFSPNGEYLLAGGKRDQVFLWDVSDNSLITHYENSWLPAGQPFSEDSSTFAKIRVDEIRDRRQGDKPVVNTILEGFSVDGSQQALYGPFLENARVQFIQDDTILMSGTMTRSRAWDVTSSEEVYLREGYNSGCQLVQSRNNDSILWVASKVGVMLDWDEITRRVCARSERFGSIPAALSADRTRMAFINENGLIEMNDMTSGEILWRISSDHPVTSLQFSPDGSYLVATSNDGSLVFWNTQDGSLIHTLAAHFDAVNALAISPDGQRIATGSPDGTVRIWAVPLP